ncbi:MAG: ABC transporter permease [Proteobacteria bacterium]|nr:MAG: ABC transporter permease [Pseudomonadota bacterium]
MLRIALKMLIGERGKYLGMIAGVFFAALIITQQLSIFTGLLARTVGFLDDTGLPDIWVMDPKVQYIDDIKPLQDTKLLLVRGISGVDWAMPLYRGQLKARLTNGQFQNCTVLGLDDATLIGGPAQMLQGSLKDLRRSDGVIVDEVGAGTKLARPAAEAGGKPTPLTLGDTLELNDHRAVVVGIARVSRTFQSQPVVYTTYSRATRFAPRERKLLSFILVKAQPGAKLTEVAERIRSRTGLAAYTSDEFRWMTINYFLKYTGIPINFGIAVLLGFFVGTAIVGQTFYAFTADNLRYFGTLKAMGASNHTLLTMIVLQAALVGLMGYGLGVGLASFTSFLSSRTELAFKFPWQIPVASGSAVVLICVLSAILSIRKVTRLEPAIVFKA